VGVEAARVDEVDGVDLVDAKIATSALHSVHYVYSVYYFPSPRPTRCFPIFACHQGAPLL
jgi:hypothetical protein